MRLLELERDIETLLSLMEGLQVPPLLEGLPVPPLLEGLQGSARDRAGTHAWAVLLLER
jgi:hypothetical protein